MKDKTVVDFLLYSLAGITTDSSKDDLVKAAVRRAYRDCARALTGIQKKDEISGDFHPLNKKERSEFIDTIIDALSEKMDELLDLDKTIEENWCETTALELNESNLGSDQIGLACIKTTRNNNSNPVKFGFTQKWVNMAVKYLYIFKESFELIQDDKNPLKYLNPNFENDVSVPIDRYIIKAIKSNKETESELGGYSETWSTMDSGIIEKLQKEFVKLHQKGESPLDAETRVWIEQAKKDNQ